MRWFLILFLLSGCTVHRHHAPVVPRASSPAPTVVTIHRDGVLIHERWEGGRWVLVRAEMHDGQRFVDVTEAWTEAWTDPR